jgi:hypothetical protein
LNFTNSSLNGTFAASCIGPATQQSDLNLVTFSNGSLAGTDPYNNDGSAQTSNDPYTGTYTINSDGTFSGSLVVAGTPFDYYGVISNSGAKVEYIYSAVSNGTPTAAFASCTGKLAPPIQGGTLTVAAAVTPIRAASVDRRRPARSVAAVFRKPRSLRVVSTLVECTLRCG